MSFEKINIKHTPLSIENDLHSFTDGASGAIRSEEDIANTEIADKLLAHLNLINEFKERIKAIDYLIDGADKLAGNPTYTTKDQYLINDIALLGGKDGIVDFQLFKKAVDLVIDGYDQLALINLTGVADV